MPLQKLVYVYISVHMCVCVYTKRERERKRKRERYGNERTKEDKNQPRSLEDICVYECIYMYMSVCMCIHM